MLYSYCFQDCFEEIGQLATIFGGKSIVSKNTGFETIEVQKKIQEEKKRR